MSRPTLLGVSLALAFVTPASLHAADFVRGDIDADARHQITDAVFLFDHLFLGRDAPTCADAADANDDGAVDIADGVWLLNFLFLGGREPPAPFERCGGDPTRDELDCERHAPCAGDPTGTLWHVFQDGIDCVRPPCPDWDARGPDEEVRDVTGVDVSALDLSADEEARLLDELSWGRHVVRGTLEVRPLEIRNQTLVVTEIADDVGERWHLTSSGIVCITWPCPSFAAENEDASILLSGFDIRPLGLTERDEQRVFEEIAAGRWIVRGLVVQGPTGPAGTGTTMVVLELVEPAAPPEE